MTKFTIIPDNPDFLMKVFWVGVGGDGAILDVVPIIFPELYAVIRDDGKLRPLCRRSKHNWKKMGEKRYLCLTCLYMAYSMV